jgi:hypothetical protein
MFSSWFGVLLMLMLLSSSFYLFSFSATVTDPSLGIHSPCQTRVSGGQKERKNLSYMQLFEKRGWLQYLVSAWEIIFSVSFLQSCVWKRRKDMESNQKHQKAAPNPSLKQQKEDHRDNSHSWRIPANAFMHHASREEKCAQGWLPLGSPSTDRHPDDKGKRKEITRKGLMGI